MHQAIRAVTSDFDPLIDRHLVRLDRRGLVNRFVAWVRRRLWQRYWDRIHAIGHPDHDHGLTVQTAAELAALDLIKELEA